MPNRLASIVVLMLSVVGCSGNTTPTVLPATWSVQSAGMAALRGALNVLVSFWVIGRLLVASIHRHIELTPR